MKKIIALLLALTMVFALAACAKQTTETPATETTTTPETTTTEENTTTEETPAAETTEAADLKVGVFYYTFADTYISSVRTALDAQLDSLGVAYQNFDGNNNQTTQNEQIQTAVTDGYNLLVVNGKTAFVVDQYGHFGTSLLLQLYMCSIYRYDRFVKYLGKKTSCISIAP